jgi:hypothetical protein
MSYTGLDQGLALSADDSHNVVRDFASASVIRIAGRSGAADSHPPGRFLR